MNLSQGTFLFYPSWTSGWMTAIRISSPVPEEHFTRVCGDDGAGISPDDKRCLFDRGSGKNTGPGLFLSREILAITGITIAGTSEPGKGARSGMPVQEGEIRSEAEPALP